MGVYAELRGFVVQHRPCGVLRGDAEALTETGYRLWIACHAGRASSGGSRPKMLRPICYAPPCWRSRTEAGPAHLAR